MPATISPQDNEIRIDGIGRNVRQVDLDLHGLMVIRLLNPSQSDVDTVLRQTGFVRQAGSGDLSGHPR